MFTLVRAESTAGQALLARHQWPLRITATDSITGQPAPIFVMQVAAPVAAELGDDFSCVASVQQLSELPTSSTTGMPFYRVASVTLLCRNPDLAVEAWEKIQDTVQDLVNNLTATLVLADVETVTITSQL